MRIILLGLALVLCGCGSSDPFAGPLPAVDDQQGIDAVLESVPPADRALLARYFARQRDAARGRIPPQASAQSVGGAINDQRRTEADMAEAGARKRAAAALLDRGPDDDTDAVERMLSNLGR